MRHPDHARLRHRAGRRSDARRRRQLLLVRNAAADIEPHARPPPDRGPGAQRGDAVAHHPEQPAGLRRAPAARQLDRRHQGSIDRRDHLRAASLSRRFRSSTSLAGRRTDALGSNRSTSGVNSRHRFRGRAAVHRSRRGARRRALVVALFLAVHRSARRTPASPISCSPGGSRSSPRRRPRSSSPRRISRRVVEAAGAAAQIAGGDLSTTARARRAMTTPNSRACRQSLNSMAERLEDLRDLDRQFLLAVSHDLRTPLTSILGYAEAIAEGQVSDVGARRRGRRQRGEPPRATDRRSPRPCPPRCAPVFAHPRRDRRRRRRSPRPRNHSATGSRRSGSRSSSAPTRTSRSSLIETASPRSSPTSSRTRSGSQIRLVDVTCAMTSADDRRHLGDRRRTGHRRGRPSAHLRAPLHVGRAPGARPAAGSASPSSPSSSKRWTARSRSPRPSPTAMERAIDVALPSGLLLPRLEDDRPTRGTAEALSASAGLGRPPSMSSSDAGTSTSRRR